MHRVARTASWRPSGTVTAAADAKRPDSGSGGGGSRGHRAGHHASPRRIPRGRRLPSPPSGDSRSARHVPGHSAGRCGGRGGRPWSKTMAPPSSPDPPRPDAQSCATPTVSATASIPEFRRQFVVHAVGCRQETRREGQEGPVHRAFDVIRVSAMFDHDPGRISATNRPWLGPPWPSGSIAAAGVRRRTLSLVVGTPRESGTGRRNPKRARGHVWCGMFEPF